MARKQKTLNDLITSDKDCFIPADVSGVLQCAPYTINVMARERPEKLNFPVTLMGNRVKIPRIPFLKYMGVADDLIESRGKKADKSSA